MSIMSRESIEVENVDFKEDLNSEINRIYKERIEVFVDSYEKSAELKTDATNMQLKGDMT